MSDDYRLHPDLDPNGWSLEKPDERDLGLDSWSLSRPGEMEGTET